MQTTIRPPRVRELLAPLLGSLPAAAIASEPPTALLPLLSPILRQRVQLLSASSQEPWLSLLCYNQSKISKLEQAVKNEALEPHPVSGEVEVDWEYDVNIKYKRVDQETLQALASLLDLGLIIKLVWCVGDEAGGGDGWRIGEVGIPEEAGGSWGERSIVDAEEAFKTRTSKTHNGTSGNSTVAAREDENDDDDYWAQYDNTPSRTPAQNSPAPPSLARALPDEDAYYAQYAGVQAAMDNHDPDEAQQTGDIETSLGRDEITTELQQTLSSPPDITPSSLAWSPSDDHEAAPYTNGISETLLHPRPSSSTGSSGSDTVAKLEKRAAANALRDQSELGIKQHISTSMKSLYRLARVSGIDREEFDRLVRTELDCLGLMDEDD